MKNMIWAFMICIYFTTQATSQTSNTQKEKNHTSSKPANVILYGDFESRIPCQEIAVELGMEVSMACDKRKLRLLLYQDAVTHTPATYTLRGMGIYSGEGKWRMLKGMNGDPNAIIYQLDMGAKKIYLYKGDENVLFFLDNAKRFLTGNAHYSYTLNRIRDEKSWSNWRHLANKGLSF